MTQFQCHLPWQLYFLCGGFGLYDVVVVMIVYVHCTTTPYSVFSLFLFLSLSFFLVCVTVFCPGDEGLFWYTVIQGSLEMLKSDMETSKVIIYTSVFLSREPAYFHYDLTSLSLSLPPSLSLSLSLF